MADYKTYRAFQNELYIIEAKIGYNKFNVKGLYLADESVDHQNVCMNEDDEGYYDAMMSSAIVAAGERASEAGFNINLLLGRTVY